MLAADEIFGHLLTFLVLCAAAALPGYSLSVMLPARLRTRHFWLAVLALGAAYWAAALYVFPFRGGLWVAVGLALAAFVATVFTRLRSHGGRGGALSALVHTAGASRPRRPSRRRRRGACLILVAGALPFATPLIFKHLPDGMDASRYMYNARLIAEYGGLPASLGPFAPSVPFGAANHGIPALTALAVMCGASPATRIARGDPLHICRLDSRRVRACAHGALPRAGCDNFRGVRLAGQGHVGGAIVGRVARRLHARRRAVSGSPVGRHAADRAAAHRVSARAGRRGAASDARLHGERVALSGGAVCHAGRTCRLATPLSRLRVWASSCCLCS